MPPKKADAKAAPAPAAAPVIEVIDPGPEIDLRKEKISIAFHIYDPEHTGSVKAEDVPTIMRYLRLYVTDKDFVDKVLPEMQGEDTGPFVHYSAFEKKMIELLSIHEFEPDTEDTLLSAFRTLDPENNGWIKLNKFRDMMLGGESSFKEDEWAAMLAVLRVGKQQDEDGNDFDVISYENYIAMVAR